MKVRQVTLLVICSVLLMGLKACPPKHETARDAIAAAKGFIEKAQQNHLAECTAQPEKSLCVAINKAVDAQNLAIDALDAYCAGPFWLQGAACDPQALLADRLQQAVRNLNDTVKSLKELVR